MGKSSSPPTGPQPYSVTSLVVFTTVDGTLRHRETGSCAEVRAALGLLASHDVPVVLLSERTADEVRWIQSELGIRHPFIAEGGAALYAPIGCFPELHGLGEVEGDWQVVTFQDVPDPAQAIRLLLSLYRLQAGTIFAIGLGAESRDHVLLREVDVPVIVRSDADDQVRLCRSMPAAYVTRAEGPAGWSEAILGSVGQGA
jgi:predicted mannosyl-3-phosphoglycerate phosphatase (HAD superfamily)